MSRAPAIVLVMFLVSACGSSAGAQPTASRGVATAIPAPTAAALPVFAAGEPLIGFNQLTGAGGGVFVARPDGSGMVQLATDVLPGVHKRFDWSPDGGRVVFIDETTERMWIAHLDGSPTEAIPACDTPGCDFPAWSPDGKRIAFSRSEPRDGVSEGPGAVGVHVVDLATGTVTDVITLERPHLADAPRWSPDGAQMVFSVDQMDDAAYETGAAIAVVPVAGGEPRFLTEFEMFASTPDWNWKTGEIAFSTDLLEGKQTPGPGDDTRNLYAIQADGSGLRQITHAQPGQALRAPRWTPDGSAITSYDMATEAGILVDPATGTFEPLVTKSPFTRPVVRRLGDAP